MRGSGIGSIFSSVFRTLIPIAKSIFGITKKAAASPIGQQVMRAAKRSAVKAGIDLAQDTLAGENVGKSIKKRARQAGRQVLEDLESGKGRSRGTVKKQKKKTMCSAKMPKKKKKMTKKKAGSPAKKKKKKKKTTKSPGWMLQQLGL